MTIHDLPIKLDKKQMAPQQKIWLRGYTHDEDCSIATIWHIPPGDGAEQQLFPDQPPPTNLTPTSKVTHLSEYKVVQMDPRVSMGNSDHDDPDGCVIT